MSDTDSFIDEVTDEVRRDQLFALFRRYGWIGIVAILMIVGGASWYEWRKARAEAAAQAFGDALVSAVGNNEPAARARALAEVAAGGSVGDAAGRAAMVTFLQAAEAEAAGDHAGAVAAISAIAGNAGLSPLYRDLAQLKLVLLDGAAMDVAARDQTLAALAQPGAPYRTLAMEQQALILIDGGKTDEAVTLLRAIAEDADAAQSQRGRIGQILTALGVETADG